MADLKKVNEPTKIVIKQQVPVLVISGLVRNHIQG